MGDVNARSVIGTFIALFPIDWAKEVCRRLPRYYRLLEATLIIFPVQDVLRMIASVIFYFICELLDYLMRFLGREFYILHRNAECSW